jgi:hypothetical protein
MGEATDNMSVIPDRKCRECGKELGPGEMYGWGESPLCFNCKKPRIIATRESSDEWLLGSFAIFKTRARYISIRGKIPYALIATNKRLALFDPKAKANRDIIQAKVQLSDELIAEVRMRRIRQFKATAASFMPVYGILGYYIATLALKSRFEEPHIDLSSLLACLGSGRRLSDDEVSVLSSLDRTYSIAHERPSLRFYQWSIQRFLAPGWWKMQDERGSRYLVGFNVHDFCQFYFDKFCTSR